MTGMMLYLSLGLMVLSVISNRYWRRQLAVMRSSHDQIRTKADDLTKEVAEAAAVYAQLAHQHADTEKRVAKAEQEMQAALLEYDRRRDGPVARYYVFDRIEPRPGRFWEAAVRHAPAESPMASLPQDRTGQRAWTGIRRYVLIADTEREARERVEARFPRKGGFHLLELVPCRLTGLSVNRVPEFRTFRKPTAATEDAKPPRRAATALARS